MSSIIKVTPLSGAKSEDPPCYLLEIDDFCILLDCGWNDLFDESILEPLKKVASKVDVVLLSHPDLTHLGALPYAKSKLGLNAQVYGTIPLFKMGQMFMYDVYQSRHNNEDFSVFDLDDVDAAFENFKQLKYSQHLMLPGKGQGIEITPYAAGHMIGGTIWKITKETDEIIYAVDYNHKKERHLSGTVLETLTRPSLLITDAHNALSVQVNRRQRDTELFEDTLRTLRNGGNVLLPTDTAGRVLELLLSIDQYWTYNRMVYTVVFLNNVGYNVIEFAKSQLEWMSDTIMKSFETSRDNPFDFKHIRLCYSLEELRTLPQPMVVLGGPGSLAPGFALDLFMQWAPNPANTVIFTSRSDAGTLAEKLLTRNVTLPLELDVGRRVPLDGEELQSFQKTERETRQKDDEKKRAQQVEQQRTVWERDRAMASDDGFTDPFHDRFDMPASRFQELGVGFPMYPHTEHKMEWEDYGEHDEFLSKMAQESQGDKPAENGKEDKMEVEEEEVEPKIPTKIVTNKVLVNVQCTIKYIDFEGRADGRSIKTIVTHVAPRRLVVVRGTPAAIDSLVQHAEQTLKHACKSVEAPDLEQTVDLTSDTSIFKVRLKDTLVDTLQFTQVGDYELAFIDGVLATSPFAQILPMLEPADTPQGQLDNSSVYVGDVKLRDFREILAKAGFSTQFDQGILICNGTVSLRKEDVEGESRIMMEGLISDDYFKVRELLYKQYHCI